MEAESCTGSKAVRTHVAGLYRSELSRNSGTTALPLQSLSDCSFSIKVCSGSFPNSDPRHESEVGACVGLGAVVLQSRGRSLGGSLLTETARARSG